MRRSRGVAGRAGGGRVGRSRGPLHALEGGADLAHGFGAGFGAGGSAGVSGSGRLVAEGAVLAVGADGAGDVGRLEEVVLAAVAAPDVDGAGGFGEGPSADHG